MADKEERILIARSTDYTITDTAEGALFDGKIAPHCANVMTRQEAIERMAKAMADVSNITYVSEEQWKVVENGFRISAEAALNALLENKK